MSPSSFRNASVAGGRLRRRRCCLPIQCNAFSGAGAGGAGVRVRDVADDFAVLQAAPADAALPAIVIAGDRFGFRIGGVKVVLLIDEDAAGAAELLVFADVDAVLSEDLDAIIV